MLNGISTEQLISLQEILIILKKEEKIIIKEIMRRKYKEKDEE